MSPTIWHSIVSPLSVQLHELDRFHPKSLLSWYLILNPGALVYDG
jgi:hypothetical protein